MITWDLITTPESATPRSHLIARSASTWLPDTALIADMQAQKTVADTRFGCAPFARITLLPDALWHDSLTEGLLTALRPLLASPASADVVLDVTDIDEVVLAQVLRFLFNQAHTLADLHLKKTDDTAVRVRHITALCLAQQQEKLEVIFPRAAGDCPRYGRRPAAGGYASRSLYTAVCRRRGAATVRRLPRAAL
ncbi:leucyl aminopeptidase [Enterobacter cancerogenus]|uniref:Leucyl aminopeptidase n=1 Tax=Enterobacter cancerogenus TaxID=69218 RepID=A0A484YYQ0_9ENTR|nr:leucyl aminopeptidase [Enterobacter cancerogenus]